MQKKMDLDENDVKVIKAAIQLFSQYGYDNVPVWEIAFESGLRESIIKERFRTKKDLYEAIFCYIDKEISHYEPTIDDIEEILKREPPEGVLLRFITYYNMNDNQIARAVYRFVFMEQYRQKWVGDFCKEKLIYPPKVSAEKVLNYLSEKGVIPPCDGDALSETWNRTSLFYEVLTTMPDVHIDHREYMDMAKFFISIAVRGVVMIPVANIRTTWQPRDYFNENARPESALRQKVLQKALELFSEHGYNHVTLSRIAKEIKEPVNAIYGEYRNKADIMNEIMEVVYASNMDYNNNPAFEAAVNNHDHQELILNLADTYSCAKDENVCRLYKILFREQYYNEEIKDILLGTVYTDIDKITRSLDHYVSTGRLRPCETWKVATAFVHAMCSITMGAVQPDRDMAEMEKIRLKVIALLVSYLINGYSNAE